MVCLLVIQIEIQAVWDWYRMITRLPEGLYCILMHGHSTFFPRRGSWFSECSFCSTFYQQIWQLLYTSVSSTYLLSCRSISVQILVENRRDFLKIEIMLIDSLHCMDLFTYIFIFDAKVEDLGYIFLFCWFLLSLKQYLGRCLIWQQSESYILSLRKNRLKCKSCARVKIVVQ